MIRQIEVYKQKLHFHAPFRIAYEQVEETELAILKIVTEDGMTGLGNAAPDTEVTGETLEEVLKVLKANLTPKFFTDPLDSWYKYHWKIQEVFRGFPSAQAAAEESLLSLWSQKTGMPLSIFFGGCRSECPVMITIGIKDEKGTEDEIKRRLKEGFSIIKLKCGLDADEDLRRIKKACALVPKECHLVLDANQGYSFADAKKLLSALRGLRIDLIEQPIDAADTKGLKRLHQVSPIPVIADEAVISVEDAMRLLTNDIVAGVNIKLMKCGGPINFMQIFHLAKRLNKIIMMGCMYETNISMTTGGHLALGLPIDYVDLDSGPLDFYDDPTSGGALIQNGSIRIESPITIE